MSEPSRAYRADLLTRRVKLEVSILSAGVSAAFEAPMAAKQLCSQSRGAAGGNLVLRGHC